MRTQSITRFNRRLVLFLLTIVYCLPHSCSEEDKTNANWIDPLDPMRKSSDEQTSNFEQVFVKNEVAKPNVLSQDLSVFAENKINHNENVSYREFYVQLVSSIWRRLQPVCKSNVYNHDEQNRELSATIFLSASDVERLDRFVSLQHTEQNSCQGKMAALSGDINRALGEMFVDVHPQKQNISDVDWFQLLYYEEIRLLCLVVIVFLGIIGIFTIYVKTTIRQVVVHLLVLIFLISVPWQWLLLYQRALAKRMTNVPAECRPAETLMDSIASIFLYFSLTWRDDKCARYFENLHVNPLFEVNPMQAVAATLASMFIEPARYLGRAIREFYFELMFDMPVQFQVAFFIGTAILGLAVLFMFNRYKLHLPFYVSVEPSADNSSNMHKMHAALLQHLEELQKKLEENMMILAQRDTALQRLAFQPALRSIERRAVQCTSGEDDDEKEEANFGLKSASLVSISSCAKCEAKGDSYRTDR